MTKSEFFAEEQGAAVVKHGVLRRYLQPFASKTGRYAPSSRVAYLDAYAGAGTYESGAPGSPILAAQTAEFLEGVRNLESYLVEKDPGRCQQLGVAVAGYENAFVFQGTIEQHIDTILDKTAGCPMFAFFDPFGLLLPMDQIRKVMDRPGTTEVLLTMLLPGLRRTCGLLKELKTDHEPSHKARITTLNKVDAALGGEWWREIWLSLKKEDGRDEQIVRGYVDRLRGTLWNSMGVPVSDRWEGFTVYYLIHLTKHPDGVWIFHEALSGATQDFFEFTHRNHQPRLEDDLEYRSAIWVDTITNNVRDILEHDGSVVPARRILDVFGETAGEAREMHLRAALKELEKDGVIPPGSSKGKLGNKTITRARG